MSTDEYKRFFVHYNLNNNNQNNHYCLGPTTTTTTTTATLTNFYKNNNIFYETVFEKANNKRISDKNSLNSSKTTTTTNQKSLTFQSTDDVNNNKNVKPMNLITNTGLDLSHSIRKPTTYNNNNNNNNHHHSNNHSHSLSYTTTTTTTTTAGNYYENASLNLLNSNYPNTIYALSPSSSSSSSSIDVENDDKDDKEACSSEPILMSPVSIPTPHQQKPLLADTRNTSQSAYSAMELTAGAIPSPFSLSYQQLYANNTALYGAPVMFSGAIHAAHASYMTGLPLHAALSPNDSYLKAIQAAACGIYSPTALTAAPAAPQAVVIPPHTAASTSSSSSSLNCKSSPTVSAPINAPTLHNSSITNVINLAPATPPSPVAHTKSSPHHLYSTNVMSNCNSNGNSNLKHELTKKDYHVSAMQSQTRLSATNNSHNGTYLNDKVNERLSGVDAAKDSHFKVPNGKEGSLKHRILRPASNVDPATDANKTPIMRTYSSTSNFRKGNYIELANGTLRRVEDMRTEDFIQCAERSPHHQLAESTVVKINTSLLTTAVITFSYDRNRSKVDMEVSFDHPFFVYGQGWASCHPEMSLKMFGLKCQRLQVGDICISLTKREQIRQHVPPLTALAPTTVLPTQINEVVNYQRKPAMTVSSPNAHTNDMPTYAHAFTMPVVQPTASHHLHQPQQAYAEMAKLMSSYAYVKALPHIPHEQLKDVVMDAPKMMSAFYQNQIFQFAQQQQQQQQQQEHLRHRASAMSLGHYNASSHSPTQPTDLEQQPPQTQPLDVTMSRKRRWSAPENMFDDEDSETQPPRNGSSPATARL